ncbi:MAG: SDR family oxidoreductase [Spirochaetales bacterium]|nr:SDR family oxidoreductase [Spirochaetales bacterium]
MSPLSLEERAAALRGCTWNGRAARTLRATEDDSTTDEIIFSSDEFVLPDNAVTVESIVTAYRDRLTHTGMHPARIRIGDTVWRAAATAADPEASIPLDEWSDGHASDPMVAVRDDRRNVVMHRVAIVTGGAQGFGYEIARGLAASGAQVAIADLNLDGAKEGAVKLDAVSPTPGVHRALHVDVADEESVAAMVAEVVRHYGGIDIVVSNAGVLKAGSVKELSASDFDFVTRVNYRGFFLVSKHAARLTAVQNAAARTVEPGRPMYSDIIEINSKSGLAGSNKNGAYAGSKFGGIGLVQSFAMELIADNIKVNAICPGNFFDGPLWSDPERGLFVQYLRTGKVPGARTVEEVRRAYEAKVPMGRGCSGADVVRAIMYVVEQRYETGQAVPVTGGQEMLR